MSAAKRASILKAARENFLRNGFSQTSMIDIAHDADVSTATLYKHFVSKEALFTAVLDEVPDLQVSKEWLENDKLDTEAALTGWARNSIDLVFDSEINAFLRLIISEVSSTPDIAESMIVKVAVNRQNLAARLQTMVKKKKLKPHDTEFGAILISGVLKECFVWPGLLDSEFSATPAERTKIITRLIRTYLELYKA